MFAQGKPSIFWQSRSSESLRTDTLRVLEDNYLVEAWTQSWEGRRANTGDDLSLSLQRLALSRNNEKATLRTSGRTGSYSDYQEFLSS